MSAWVLVGFWEEGKGKGLRYGLADRGLSLVVRSVAWGWLYRLAQRYMS